MNPYELLHPNGKPCGIFCCGKCNRIVAKELADKCCAPCPCGKEPINRFGEECWDCCHARIDKRNQEALDAAEEVEWYGETMVFSEDHQGYHDGWFASPLELIESFQDDHDAECDGGVAPPQFAFASTVVVKKFDIERGLERMTEDTYEDAEVSNTAAIAELQKAVDVFNEKCAITYFEPDYSRKVRIPLERLTENA